MESIYDRIEHLIAAKRITKKHFCDAVHISTGNLGDWRSGKSLPSSSKLIDIAAYFEVSLDWLMIGKQRENYTVREAQNTYEYYQDVEIVSIKQLLPSEKAFIMEYIRFAKSRRQDDPSPSLPPVEER